MKKATPFVIYFNPNCKTCRDALESLEEQNCPIEIVRYLDTPPTKAKLKELLVLLKMEAKDLIRRKEPQFKELFPDGIGTESQLINAMVQHPRLIERPIIISGKKAFLGRPASKVKEMLANH